MELVKLIIAAILVLNMAAKHVRTEQTPMFYGWFFNETVAGALKAITDTYLKDLYDHVPEVQSFLDEKAKVAGIKDPLQYYTKPLDPNTAEYDPFFHITAFYCGTNDCTSYTNQVAEYLNKVFQTNLVGVFFTPRTYGIRINLTDVQQEIFEIVGESTNNVDDWLLNEYEPPCESTPKDGIQFCPQDEENFHPTNTRAHVTLGCSPNVSAVVTGLDLIEILALEDQPTKKCWKKIPAPQGNLIQMGDDCDIFVYYLNQEMIANSTFEVYYNKSPGICTHSYLLLMASILPLIFSKF